ncbi:MAG: ATP-binding protein, partial [Bacteroidota bacterium]
QFLLHHPDLFPNIPLVFCGVNYFDERKRPPYATGVIEGIDLRGTIDAALRLQPHAKRVVTVNDRSQTGQSNKRLVQALIPAYGNLSFQFLEDLTVAELLRDVERLPKDTIVLLLTFNRDRAGKAISYDQLVQGVTKASSAPVYGVWDFFLGRGIVGGSITRGFDQGNLAAHLAARILQGESPARIPIVRKVPNQPMFDYRAMQRFSLPLSALPTGSVIINRPPDRYSIPKSWFWSGLFMLLLLALSSIILLFDIAGRRRTERHLRESESKFRTLTEMAPLAIFIEREGRFRYLNPTLEELSGYREEELCRMDVASLLHPEERGGYPFSGLAEVRILRKDGRLRWGILCLQGLRFEGKRAILGTIYDITERKRAEEERATLQRKEERITALEEADRLKNEFLSVISHELRTPLNSITGFTSLLDDEVGGQLNETQHQYLRRILEGSERMLSLINDLLDLARMQAGKFDFDFALVPYPPLLEEAIAFIEPLANQKRLLIEREIEVSVPLCLDGNRIEQLLINLLSNAVKFTPKGGWIRVKAWIEGRQCITEVSDSGIGIAPEDLQKLFAPFTQLDMGMTRKSGGTGLGLSISKKIVEAHDGTISVSSSGPGKGSTFRFTLPLDRAETPLGCVPKPNLIP